MRAPQSMSPAAGAGVLAAVACDGHHPNTDVVAAWLSESAGRLQAVIRPRTAVWEPAHDVPEAARRRAVA